MPLKESAQWRLDVIAAYPLAPVGDKKGFRSQAIAKDSMSRSLQVTAFLDPDATHSYISCTLALYLLGEEGLKLAQSAAHEMQLGQVGTILSCDESQQTQTECFLLSDMDGIDMLLSQRSWMCLERQCPTLSLSDKLTSSLELWSLSLAMPSTLAFHEPRRPSFEDFQASIGANLSCASSGTPDPGSDDEPSERGSHTPCSRSGVCPSPTLCCSTANDTAKISAQSRRQTADLSLREYHIPYRIAHRSDSGPTRQDSPTPSLAPVEQESLCSDGGENTWSWDPKRQNYYCRDRDEDDEWYWYPTDIV
jgi:hypothetical protein